jgi:hypothetical protein
MFYAIVSKSNVCLGGQKQTWVASMCEIGEQRQLNGTEWYLAVLDLCFLQHKMDFEILV